MMNHDDSLDSLNNLVDALERHIDVRVECIGDVVDGLLTFLIDKYGVEVLEYQPASDVQIAAVRGACSMLGVTTQHGILACYPDFRDDERLSYSKAMTVVRFLNNRLKAREGRHE